MNKVVSLLIEITLIISLIMNIGYACYYGWTHPSLPMPELLAVIWPHLLIAILIIGIFYLLTSRGKDGNS